MIKIINHPSQDLIWSLSRLASYVDAVSFPQSPPVLAEFARYSDRIADDDGHEYRENSPSGKATVFPYERSFQKLLDVFQRAAIHSTILARHVESLNGETPRKLQLLELQYALLEVDLTQDNLNQKIRDGMMLATAWRYTEMFRGEFPEANSRDTIKFLAELHSEFDMK